MKVMVPFLIVRKNHNVIVAEPLKNPKTLIELFIPLECLDKEEINALVECEGGEEYDYNIILKERPADTFHIKLESLRVGVEYVGVDVL